MPVPGSPLPLFSAPPRVEDRQVSLEPVEVSVRMNLPDFIDTGPPGWTVHVVAARTGVTPRTAASTAAGTATRYRTRRLATRRLPPQVGPALVQVLNQLVPSAAAGQESQRRRQRGKRCRLRHYFPMVYSQCDQASAWAAQVAQEHGLVCYDPQIGKLRP